MADVCAVDDQRQRFALINTAAHTHTRRVTSRAPDASNHTALTFTFSLFKPTLVYSDLLQSVNVRINSYISYMYI